MAPRQSTPWPASAAALAAIWLMVVSGCGGQYQGFDLDACERFPSHSVWKVTLDHGDGRVVQQNWTLDKHLCSLDFVAQPSDEFTPGPGSTAYGTIDPPGFAAQWFNQVGSCHYFVDVHATLAGDTFTAVMDWKRSLIGSGECPPAQGRISASAVRQ